MYHQMKNVIHYVGMKFKSQRGEFGMGAIISMAIGIIVASFVMVPSMQSFAQTIMTSMNDWWSNSISAKVFPTNGS
jgi:hypothetical protein